LSYADDSNAWLVEPTGAAFASAVKEVLENKEQREQKVLAAVETARANTREASTDRLFATYDRIFAEFNGQREMFTDIEAAKKFDFVKLLDRGQAVLQTAIPAMKDDKCSN
ncbi:MAG: hypothetical protein ABI539_12055, partial [Acidobacteriota bacterium]